MWPNSSPLRYSEFGRDGGLLPPRGVLGPLSVGEPQPLSVVPLVDDSDSTASKMSSSVERPRLLSPSWATGSTSLLCTVCADPSVNILTVRLAVRRAVRSGLVAISNVMGNMVAVRPTQPSSVQLVPLQVSRCNGQSSGESVRPPNESGVSASAMDDIQSKSRYQIFLGFGTTDHGRYRRAHGAP